MNIPQRIMVIGPMGAGKSTFSQTLGKILHLPVIHFDKYYWQPGWQAVNSETWRTIVDELTQPKTWITDGNYSGTWDIRLPRAEQVIWLDYPRWIYFYRVFKRRIVYHDQTRPDIGCTEQLDWGSLRLLWQYQHKRPGYEQRIAQAGKPLIHLQTPREATRYLRAIIMNHQKAVHTVEQ